MRALALALVLPLAACASDLRDDFPFDGALPGDGHVQSEVQADGSTVSLVDATNKTSYVYFDLDTGKELNAGEALDTGHWDLTFQRFKITSNGGSGGPGTVTIALVKGVGFDALEKAPVEGYLSDGADTVFNGVDEGWYFYDLGKHKLVTRTDRLYVVRSGEGRYFKVQMLDYYDSAGTAARPSFRWREVPAP